MSSDPKIHIITTILHYLLGFTFYERKSVCLTCEHWLYGTERSQNEKKNTGRRLSLLVVGLIDGAYGYSQRTLCKTSILSLYVVEKTLYIRCSIEVLPRAVAAQRRPPVCGGARSRTAAGCGLGLSQFSDKMKQYRQSSGAFRNDRLSGGVQWMQSYQNQVRNQGPALGGETLYEVQACTLSSEEDLLRRAILDRKEKEMFWKQRGWVADRFCDIPTARRFLRRKAYLRVKGVAITRLGDDFETIDPNMI